MNFIKNALNIAEKVPNIIKKKNNKRNITEAASQIQLK